VKKVIKTFSGAYLLRDKERAEKILRRIIQSVNIPVTVKIRSGWNASDEIRGAVELAKIAEDCGVAAVTVHGRTAAQGYAGKADWSVISEVKQKISIPVIGNGDVKRPEDSLEILKTTGCDGVMIGRASIGNPWIFKGCTELMSGNSVSEVSGSERFSVITDHLMAMIDYYGERIGIKKMRTHLLQYTKGFPESARFRGTVVHIDDKNELIDEVGNFFLDLEK
jgi:tRNA-dihydrouridine synthase B